MVARSLWSWHAARWGRALLGLGSFGLAYLFGSLAVNSGSLWQWTLTPICFVAGLVQIAKSLRFQKGGTQ